MDVNQARNQSSWFTVSALTSWDLEYVVFHTKIIFFDKVGIISVLSTS